mmetsp:Transcript_64426/g.75578  ORF Transcript_64426/g.75578 Transcript_64426/m.75578 type:complete len:91 (+) Transcript_64426:33-305(+)
MLLRNINGKYGNCCWVNIRSIVSIKIKMKFTVAALPILASVVDGFAFVPQKAVTSSTALESSACYFATSTGNTETVAGSISEVSSQLKLR